MKMVHKVRMMKYMMRSFLYLYKNEMNKRITQYFFEFQNGFGAVREKG